MQRVCCSSSRLSTSSPPSSAEPRPERSESLPGLSIVQSRLQRMINESKAGRSTTRPRRSGRRFAVLLAVGRDSYDPRTDFRESMMEVIASEEMQEPKELRSLLDCYMSLNPPEHRQVILEAFHEVCSRLFLCNDKSNVE